jgi:hypothetical protein
MWNFKALNLSLAKMLVLPNAREEKKHLLEQPRPNDYCELLNTIINNLLFSLDHDLEFRLLDFFFRWECEEKPESPIEL